MNINWSPLIISIKTAFLSTSITFFLGILVSYLMANYKGKYKPFTVEFVAVERRVYD